MSEPKKKKAEPATPRFFGWVAEYADENVLLEAARRVRDSGYTKTDAFIPFPVHGIDEALGIKPTILPFIVLGAGFTGVTTALVMQIWMNAVDYPYIISGKPFISLPAFIPIGFELTVLFSAFTTFLGMLALNGLPRFSNPVFTNPRFDRSTDDRFFLYIDAKDKYFNKEAVRKLLADTHPESLDEVLEDSSPAEIPRAIWLALGILVMIALIPPAIVLRMRASKSADPRIHVFLDMDFQPKKKPQQSTTLFADKRAMRPQVAGTVARGQLETSGSYYLGYDPEKLASAAPIGNTRFVSTDAQQPPATEPAPAPEAAPAPAPAAAAPPAAPGEVNLDTLPWIDSFPEGVVTEANMERGKKRFEIYCGACHGVAGDGDGLVARRAADLAQGFWTPPTSLHDLKVRSQPIGRIFHTITNGKGKMGGYSSQISAADRWAIALYVRALQRSRHAEEKDIPESEKAVLAAP